MLKWLRGCGAPIGRLQCFGGVGAPTILKSSNTVSRCIRKCFQEVTRMRMWGLVPSATESPVMSRVVRKWELTVVVFSAWWRWLFQGLFLSGFTTVEDDGVFFLFELHACHGASLTSEVFVLCTLLLVSAV